jgi:predicted enzyme related to lactoylglutathione lyase
MVAAAVIYVKDLRRMQSFYETCFTLVVAESDGSEFCVLTSDDGELSLVTVPADIAGNLNTTDPPQRRTDTPIKPVFDVESIEDLRSVVPAAGG